MYFDTWRGIWLSAYVHYQDTNDHLNDNFEETRYDEELNISIVSNAYRLVYAGVYFIVD